MRDFQINPQETDAERERRICQAPAFLENRPQFNLESLRQNESVLVRAIIPANNPTYLKPGGLYRATRRGSEINFRSVITGSGTYERLPMLRAFARNFTLTFELIDSPEFGEE
jgi:hypothetical protein